MMATLVKLINESEEKDGEEMSCCRNASLMIMDLRTCKTMLRKIMSEMR